MSHVLCASCGRYEDVRSMQACSNCGDYICPACISADTFCPRCMSDESLKQDIL